jgi:hypothetical protein
MKSKFSEGERESDDLEIDLPNRCVFMIEIDPDSFGIEHHLGTPSSDRRLGP